MALWPDALKTDPKDLSLIHRFIVYPGGDRWPLAHGVDVAALQLGRGCTPQCQ